MVASSQAVRGGVQTVVGYDHLPAEIRALCPLERPDYADLFVAHSGSAVDISPEELVRLAFAKAPAWIRTTVPFVQGTILGLELHKPPFETGYLIGFRIVERGKTWFRLEANSLRLGTANLVGKIDGDQISIATFVKYTSRLSGAVWEPISWLHRLVGQILMRRSVSEAARMVRDDATART